MSVKEIEYLRMWATLLIKATEPSDSAQEAIAALNKVCDLALIGREHVATRAEGRDGESPAL